MHTHPHLFFEDTPSGGPRQVPLKVGTHSKATPGCEKNWTSRSGTHHVPLVLTVTPRVNRNYLPRPHRAPHPLLRLAVPPPPELRY